MCRRADVLRFRGAFSSLELASAALAGDVIDSVALEDLVIPSLAAALFLAVPVDPVLSRSLADQDQVVGPVALVSSNS